MTRKNNVKMWDKEEEEEEEEEGFLLREKM
jgi:hypothetical protein